MRGRNCATCKFAEITHGQRVPYWENVVTVYQDDESYCFCCRPGGPGNVSWNMNVNEFECDTYEKREEIDDET